MGVHDFILSGVKMILKLTLHVALLCLASATRQYDAVIEPRAESHYGTWGDEEFCPEGSWAGGFRLMVEENQGVGDDTALNAVELDCYNSEDEKVRTISSSQGDFGEWGHHSYCSDRQVLTGISFRSERPETKTTDGEHLRSDNGAIWGTWSSKVECPEFMAICGIKTQVQEYQGLWEDDTALNALVLYCCFNPFFSF